MTDAVRARRLYPRSRAFRTVYVRGARAARSGFPREGNPYAGRRGGWGNVWARAWLRGYDDAGLYS